SEADAEIGYLILARIADGRDFAFNAAIAEAPRNQDGIQPGERCEGVRTFQVGGVEVFQRDRDVVVEAAADQRFVQRLSAVLQVDGLADDTNLHGARWGLLDLPDRLLPVAGLSLA